MMENPTAFPSVECSGESCNFFGTPWKKMEDGRVVSGYECPECGADVTPGSEEKDGGG
jgi:hypothetical protein